MQGEKNGRLEAVAVLCRDGGNNAVRLIQQREALCLGTTIQHQQPPGFYMSNRRTG